MIKELLHLRDLDLAWQNNLENPVFFFRMGKDHSESLQVELVVRKFSWEKDSQIYFYRFFLPQQMDVCNKLTQLTWVKKSVPQLLLVHDQTLLWYKSGKNISMTDLTEALSLFPEKS